MKENKEKSLRVTGKFGLKTHDGIRRNERDIELYHSHPWVSSSRHIQQSLTCLSRVNTSTLCSNRQTYTKVIYGWYPSAIVHFFVMCSALQMAEMLTLSHHETKRLGIARDIKMTKLQNIMF